MSDNEAPTAGLLPLLEAAAYLNVTEHWMRRAVVERRIPYHKLGKLIYFKVADLDAYVEASRQPAGEDAAWDAV